MHSRKPVQSQCTSSLSFDNLMCFLSCTEFIALWGHWSLFCHRLFFSIVVVFNLRIKLDWDDWETLVAVTVRKGDEISNVLKQHRWRTGKRMDKWSGSLKVFCMENTWMMCETLIIILWVLGFPLNVVLVGKRPFVSITFAVKLLWCQNTLISKTRFLRATFL